MNKIYTISLCIMLFCQKLPDLNCISTLVIARLRMRRGNHKTPPKTLSLRASERGVAISALPLTLSLRGFDRSRGNLGLLNNETFRSPRRFAPREDSGEVIDRHVALLLAMTERTSYHVIARALAPVAISTFPHFCHCEASIEAVAISAC